MKRNQDKISLWKRKKRWTQAEMREYIADQLNKAYPQDAMTKYNSLAQLMQQRMVAGR